MPGQPVQERPIYEVFVSMPFGASGSGARRYWNDFYSSVSDISQLLISRPYGLNFHRADDTITALEVRESVTALIKQSDFVLAVITGLNPNVFWEVGFAQCLGKPVVFLIEEEQQEAQRSPVLVSATLKRTYDGKIFDQAPPAVSHVSDFQRSLLPFLSTAVEIVGGQIERPLQYQVYSERDTAPLASMIVTAKKSIDLITSNLSYFADPEKFYVTIEEKKAFPFDIPIARGVKVRILSLDPDSSIAAYRAKQLGRVHDVSGYREELRQSARFFYQRYQSARNVDIRIYDDLPLQITMLVDNKVVTSVMSRGNQSRDNIHLYFDLDFKGARASFERHFAEVLANQAQTFHIANLAWARLPGDGVPNTTASELKHLDASVRQRQHVSPAALP